VVAAFGFEGVVRSLIHSLKYRNRRRVARELAVAALHRVGPAAFVGIRVVTWAPTGRTHLRRRGFDQAELLARSVAKCLGVPCRRLLYRAHGDAQQPQTGRSRAERLRGVAFVVRPALSRAFGGAPCVLLVDDVVTTGATLASARDALLDGGAGRVMALAIAATPDRSQVSPASRRTRSTAAAGSTSTNTPIIPTASAATTLVGASSRKAVRPAVTPNLDKAS
jgi:predicted amidophosphoribosyltransferase